VRRGRRRLGVAARVGAAMTPWQRFGAVMATPGLALACVAALLSASTCAKPPQTPAPDMRAAPAATAEPGATAVVTLANATSVDCVGFLAREDGAVFLGGVRAGQTLAFPVPGWALDAGAARVRLVCIGAGTARWASEVRQLAPGEAWRWEFPARLGPRATEARRT
jgi:hypothetical protein